MFLRRSSNRIFASQQGYRLFSSLISARDLPSNAQSKGSNDISRWCAPVTSAAAPERRRYPHHLHFRSKSSAVESWNGQGNGEDSKPNNNTILHSNKGADSAPSSSTILSDAWKKNLRKGSDDVWLQGPRPDSWFTGVHPRDCPGLNDAGTVLHSLPLPNLSALTQREVQAYFDNTWTLFETLFAGLHGEEGFYRPAPHGLRHPQIFYYGHTACLYVNKLRVAGLLTEPINADFESIFEVGVDEMLWDDMNKNDMMWPAVSEVWEYRQQVYDAVTQVIRTHFSNDATTQVTSESPLWSLFMGFEHERIHLETSSVLFRETLDSLVQTPLFWPPMHPSALATTSKKTTNPIEGTDYPANTMIPIDDTRNVELGKPDSFPSFGWDNEYGSRRIRVPPFQSSQYMISNGEFWQFVMENGYRNPEYWSDDGWAWRTHRNAKWPSFWQPAGPEGSHRYKLRTIFEVIPMQWDWPVDVNYYEAKAYCRWKTSNAEHGGAPFRLLTEAEHHVIRQSEQSLDAARQNVTADPVMSSVSGANLNLAFSSHNPVDALKPSHTGHFDVAGNAWEWTEDHFNPLEGFQIHPVYEDFSTPCFDGKHNMIVGGSFISTGDEASVFARFHFRPHFLQHSGFRLVSSEQDAPSTHLHERATNATNVDRPHSLHQEPTLPSEANVYETDQSLHMYLGLHYPDSGKSEDTPPILPHDNAPVHGLRFPQRVVELLMSLAPRRTNRALDIGCAVGGASFELAKHFDGVDAFDFSQQFIDTAKRMQGEEHNKVTFKVQIEGDLYQELDAMHAPGVVSPADVRSKVNFFAGDACRMDDMKNQGLLGSYDAVILSNLLCRLHDPRACLNSMSHLVNDGGIAVIVTPFTWMTEFTPREKWLGGYHGSSTAGPVRSKDSLKSIMESNGFERIHEVDMPLIIREHARKYQYIVSEATGWRKTEGTKFV